MFESGGIRHAPATPNGGVIFIIVYGSFLGYNDDGSVGGVVDAKFMWDLAEAGGAAGHLIKPPTWLE